MAHDTERYFTAIETRLSPSVKDMLNKRKQFGLQSPVILDCLTSAMNTPEV